MDKQQKINFILMIHCGMALAVFMLITLAVILLSYHESFLQYSIKTIEVRICTDESYS